MRVLCGDVFGKDVSLYPCENFFSTEFDDSTKEEQINSLSKEIFDVISSRLKDRILFKTASFGEVNANSTCSTCSEIYLKAIDTALRKCFEENKAVPVIALFLKNANIVDKQADIITNLVHDRIIGSFDYKFEHLCLIDLRSNQISCEAISRLATEITGSSVWYLDVRENCHYTEDARCLLSDLKSRSIVQLKQELPSVGENLKLEPRIIQF